MASAAALAVGAIVAVGLLVLVAAVVVQSIGTTVRAGAGERVAISPDTFGPSVAVVRWSGGDANTTVFLTAQRPSAADFRYYCQSGDGLIAKGTGADGTLTANVEGGVTYELFGCTGVASNPIFGLTLTFTYRFVGLSYLELVGAGILLVAGIVWTIRRIR